MEKKRELLPVLMKGLRAELDSIKFYAEHLADLNFETNTSAIEALTFDSVNHARMLLEEIFKLRSGEGGPLRKAAVQEALLEEFSMREIYRYGLDRFDDPEVQELLKHLIAEEQGHEQMVQRLK